MKLLIQYKEKKERIEVEDETTLGILKMMVGSLFDIDEQLVQFNVLGKPVNGFDDELIISLGIKNMTIVKVDKLDEMKEISIKGGRSNYIPKIDGRKWTVVRRKMDGDGSCLFHALEYIFNKKSRGDPYHIRTEVSEIVTLYPNKFTFDYLGMPNQVYAENILQPTTWGSNVEIRFIHS